MMPSEMSENASGAAVPTDRGAVRYGANALNVLESMEVPAALTGLDGRIQAMTSAFLALGDFDAAALVGELLETVVCGPLFPSSDSPAHPGAEEDRTDFFSGDSPADPPLNLHSQTGAAKQVHPHYSTIRDESGRAVARLFVLHDITPERQARQAAVESERSYRMLVEQANTVVMHLSVAFTIRFVNQYGARLFGYTREELMGHSLLETLIPPRDPDGEDLHAVFQEVAAAPELHRGFDLQALCTDGSWIWIHWAVRAVRNEQGDVNGLLCVGTDITRRKHAEIRAEWYLRRSRNLADKLIRTEERERFRIAQYLHDQVVQMLSLANIRMGGVLAGLKQSHREEDAARLADVRHLIEEAIGECRSMMNELVPTLLHEVGLGAALTELAAQEHLADGTSIRVDNQLGRRELPRRLSALLFQSARELLMNALKYAGPCEIEIAVRADESAVEVTVSDTGTGFAVHELDRRAESDSGGFGLFNIRERLESLGGVLSIESRAGVGTRASISVPLPE